VGEYPGPAGSCVRSLLVAGIVFLVVSDSDDDGTIELDVPSVDVGG